MELLNTNEKRIQFLKEMMLEEAELYINHKKYEKAVFFYKLILKDNPNDYKILLKLGNLYNLRSASKNQDSSVANSYYEQALLINPKIPYAWEQIGLNSIKEKNWHDAIYYFKKLIDHDPNISKTWFNLGVAYRGSGEIDEAIECYKKVLDIFPHSSQALTELMQIYRAQGRPKDEFDCSLEIKKIRMKQAEEIETLIPNKKEKKLIRFNQGISNLIPNYYDSKASSQFKKDINRFLEFIKADPDNPNLWNNLGVIYSKDDFKIPAASECFEKAIEIDSDYSPACFNLALIYKNINNEKCIEYLKKGLEISPNNIEAWTELQFYFEEMGDNREINECSRKIREIENRGYILNYPIFFSCI